MDLILALSLLYVYFIPTMIARKRGIQNLGSILFINIFFGWTVAGWFAALILSLSY